jgi:anthrone oxygenase-like protein
MSALPMILESLASLSAGLFSGAALYINLVEHPARMECGTAIALAEFAPSYHRATVMQASLAVTGSLAAVLAWLGGSGSTCLVGGILLASVVPFTLVVILPTNQRLLDPGLDPHSAEARALLERWARLHALRSILGLAAFIALM